MKNLIIRSISGAVYVGLIVGSIMLSNGVLFPVLCALFAAIGVWEFQKISLDDFYKAPLTVLVDIIIAVIMPLSVAFMRMSAMYSFLLYLFAFAFVVLIPVRMVMAIYSRQTNPVRRFAYSTASVVYVGVGLLFASFLLLESRAILLLMFVLIWVNDTGAYLVGCSFGRHRLFPRLSPKKSWEGFIGGMVCCIIVGVLAPYVLPDQFRAYSPVCTGILAVIVCVMSTWGDLFESMIKRHAGVKDSGSIIPGHGGILDRIDSLLFVAPATYIFLSLYTVFENFVIIKGA